MARHALPFLCLVGLVAIATSEPVSIIYARKGDNICMGHGENNEIQSVTRCELTPKNNSTRILWPLPDNDYDYNSKYDIPSSYERCKTCIYRIDEKDQGTYVIQTTIEGEGAQEKIIKKSYNIEVREIFEEKAVVPIERFFVYPDQLISVHFRDNFNNLKHCKLLDQNNNEYDLDKNRPANVEKLDVCGFRMTVMEESHGTWKLVADLDNSTTYYKDVLVILKDKKDLNPDQIKLKFRRGDKMLIELKFSNSMPKMCYLEDPDGLTHPMKTGACRYELGRATNRHRGVWKARYGFEGMEKLVEQKIDVDIYDDITFKSNVTHSTNGDINLLCQIPGRRFRYCSFVRPNGEILHMTFGVGNKKYEYYGNGVQYYERDIDGYESIIMDCGITIHNPDHDDYGSWRCLVKMDNKETVGSVLKVISSQRKQIASQPITTSPDVYVKRGESYKIKCTAEEVLSYCWLRSPNGTIYSVLSHENVKAPVLKYEGTGLELGDCTAFVGKANETDNGEWSCHMGIANGPEVETKLNVIVTNSHLIAERDTVLLESTSETDLIWRPLHGSSEAIEACRWVNPLGHGINVDHEGRYYTETGTSHCKLSIRVKNEEDVGRWLCYVRFAGSQDVEEFASINVTHIKGVSFGIGSLLSISICASALVTLSIGVFIIFIYKRRLAMLRNLDEKNILEKPAKIP